MVDNLMSTDEKTSQKWSTYNAIKIELQDFDPSVMDEFRYRLVDDNENPNKVVLDILSRYNNLNSELERLKKKVGSFDTFNIDENVLHLYWF
jgi:hypothetical protein